MRFQTLYKMTSTGKLQEWEIYTDENVITTIHGQIFGKKQINSETIKSGKNIGRANETTPAEQAELEARAKWTKKHDKDYHRHIDNCKEGTKIANAGGYLPMLAHSYKKHGAKYMKFPCYVQPKLDGLRCTATYNEELKLWFRSGKEITTMPHIITDLKKSMNPGDIFDGELYAHKEEFNSFTGAIRGGKHLKTEILAKIKYHCYDFPRINGLVEKDRYDKRRNEFNKLELDNAIVSVKTILVNSFEEAIEIYKQFIEEGYEGLIFRNIDSPYEQKRSYNLLKYKEFIDAEFKIIGAVEGKGKLDGHVGSFICELEDGRELLDINDITKIYLRDNDPRPDNEKGTVGAKMKGKFPLLKHYFEHPEEYMGKPLTITYQNLSPYIVPRFPIGKTIRFDK